MPSSMVRPMTVPSDCVGTSTEVHAIAAWGSSSSSIAALGSSAIDKQSDGGFTALYLAAEEGANQIVELLLARGAETALAASDGSTALMRACYFGHEQCVAH